MIRSRPLLFLILASPVLALGSPSGGVLAQGLPLPGRPSVGAGLFERNGCGFCHAVGEAPDRLGPNLGRLALRVTFQDGAARLWNHVPGMSRTMVGKRIEWPTIAGLNLVDLVAFITTYQYYLTRVGRPGDPGRGELLFRDKRCGHCHALAAGETSTGPSLRGYGRGRSVLELAQAMWNHGPKMQEMLEQRSLPRPYFRDGEMADLLAFVATQGAPRGAVGAYAEPGSPRRGAQVFADRGCARCHAIRGKGGIQGPNAPPDLGLPETALRDYTELAAQMWNHAVPMWARMRREGIPIQALKGKDLADLVAYVFFASFADSPGDPRKGERLFRERGCARCHPPDAPPGVGESVGEASSSPERAWDVLAAMWQAAPDMWEMAVDRRLEWPSIRSQEMRHIVAYLIERRKAAPKKPPTTNVNEANPDPQEEPAGPRSAPR